MLNKLYRRNLDILGRGVHRLSWVGMGNPSSTPIKKYQVGSSSSDFAAKLNLTQPDRVGSIGS